MAACSLFEDDEVCHVTLDNHYVYGVVLENAETASSDDEGSRLNVCKKGCVRIAWHPKGKESIDTPENKVLLTNRGLMISDIVRRFVPGQETQCGCVQDLHITCHLQVKGTNKFIYNVDSRLLSSCVQFQRFENGYVTMDNWLGRVEEVIDTVTLVLPDGAKCEIDDVDLYGLDDVTEKRLESTFSEDYWYPGQQLKGPLNALENAVWVKSTLLYNAKNTQSKKKATIYAAVEQVTIRSIYVYWVCRGFSKLGATSEGKISPPPREIKGDDLKRLQLVDWFEHAIVKLGDKVYYTIREEDVLETTPPSQHFVPFAAQSVSPEKLAEITHKTEDLIRNRFDENSKPRRKGSRKNAAFSVSTSSTNTTAISNVASNVSLIGACGGEGAMPVLGNHQEEMVNPQGEAERGAGGDNEAGTEADDEYEDVEDNKDEVDDSGSEVGSVSSSASGAKRRKREAGVSRSVASLRQSSSRTGRRKRPVFEIPLTPGSKVACEVVYTFSLVTVLWQNGNVEEKVPSTDLLPVHHMDELELFPGTFIVDANDPKSSEYGVVASCNRFERTCQVKWFKPYEVGKSTAVCSPTEIIKDSEISVYDVHEHPDYKFRPANNVIRVAGFEDSEQTLQAVGQVMSVNPSGTVFVHWSDDSYTACYPQDLYIVWDMNDYSNSSWDESEETTEEDSDETDASWETEEEEEHLKGEGDGEATQSDEEQFDCLKGVLDEKRREDLKELINHIRQIFETFIQIFKGLEGLMVSSRAVDTPMAQCLKEVLHMYRTVRKVDKYFKTGIVSSEPVQDFITLVRAEIKRMKCNKIKQHVESVFDSTNRSLLDRWKGNAESMEVATDTTDLEKSHRQVPKQDAASGRSSSIAQGPADATGSSVDLADYGSSVDLISPCTQSTVTYQEKVTEMLTLATTIASSCCALQNADKDDVISRLADSLVKEKLGAEGESAALTCLSAECPGAGACALPGGELLGQDVAAGANLATVLEMSVLITERLKSLRGAVNMLDAVLKESLRRNSEASNDSRQLPLDSTTEEAQTDVDNSLTQAKDKSQDGEDSRVNTVEVAEATLEESVEDQANICNTDLGDGQNSLLITGSVTKVNSGEMPETETTLDACVEEEEMEITEPPGVELPKGFFMCEQAPDCHNFYTKSFQPANAKTFNAAVRRELKLLNSSLPNGITVKGFQDRMDLFSVLIDGPVNTPYEDGLFVFDVMLPHDYPTNPPVFHYLSYASDRLNPNLYVDGKVCVSLLGTWSGKGMEVWTSKSNLLQVLVSIQGLILVDEPYYNEAGYEKQRGSQIALENSRMYNETAILKLVEHMTRLSADPPRPFEIEVRQRLLVNGCRFIARLERWMTISETLGISQPPAPGLEAAASQPLTAKLSCNGLCALVCDSGEEAASGGLENESNEDQDDSGISISDRLSAGVALHKSPQPEGLPHFPLLPMSKGLRLTLHKALDRLKEALDKLQKSMGSQNGLDTGKQDETVECLQQDAAFSETMPTS